MTNLFPLPYWALASRRVPTLLTVREDRWSLISWLSCQRLDFCVSPGQKAEAEITGPDRVALERAQ